MKLSNFRNYVINGDKFYADVDVTTGILLFKRTTTKTVCKESMFWFFVDSGEYTPDRQAENLHRAYLATQDLLSIYPENQTGEKLAREGEP